MTSRIQVILGCMQVQYFEKTGGQGLKVQYKGPDTKGKKLPISDSVACIPSMTPPPGDCPDGFIPGGYKLEFFDLNSSPSDLPDFNSLTPDKVFVPHVLNYPDQNKEWAGFPKSDSFAVRATALLLIETTGTYTFSLTSDDGSKLFVDGLLVVDNNSPPLHAFVKKQGSVSFPTAGFYEIEVKSRLFLSTYTRMLPLGSKARCLPFSNFNTSPYSNWDSILQVQYFEAAGSQGLKLEYAGADTNGQKVLIMGDSLCFEAGEFFPRRIFCARLLRWCTSASRACALVCNLRDPRRPLFLYDSVPCYTSWRSKWRRHYHPLRWPRTAHDFEIRRDANARELLRW